MSRKVTPVKAKAADTRVAADPGRLLADLREVIDEARRGAAVAVNAGLSLMYWRVGQRIRTEVLGGQRASYGAGIVATLSRQLVADYGRGFEEKSLRRMVQFAYSGHAGTRIRRKPVPDSGFMPVQQSG